MPRRFSENLLKRIAVLSLLLLVVPLETKAVAEDPAPTSGDAAQSPTPSAPLPDIMIEMDPPKSTESFQQSDIDHYFNPDQVKRLLAGDSEFYVLFQDDMTGRPRGVAMLLPDWSQGSFSGRGIEFLRTNLPDYGWVTLTMAVPEGRNPVYDTGPVMTEQSGGGETEGGDEAQQEQPPARPSSMAMVRPEPMRFIDEEYMTQYELQFKMRMQALLSEAENYPGYFIVIAQGSSAAVLASLYAKGELPEPQAMIILSANMPDWKLTQKMNLDIAQNPVPTLDIYQERGVRWAKKYAMMRKKLAKKHFKPSYRAKGLHGDISYHNQNHRLLRTIYGWLSSLGL